ncbi:hypothetical protein JHK84_043066 [Glycine max]|nr:hypothetical protein JHK84_043066 [Glycine max]
MSISCMFHKGTCFKLNDPKITNNPHPIHRSEVILLQQRCYLLKVDSCSVIVECAFFRLFSEFVLASLLTLLTAFGFLLLYDLVAGSEACVLSRVAFGCDRSKIFFFQQHAWMSIDGSKETLKLAVRITNLWFIGIPSKSEQVEMVIVDSDGDEIHVVCKQDQLKSWKANLKESSTYVMHNFKVLKNDGQFRVCNHPYKLAFTGVTIVRQSDLDSLPFRKFKFDDFSNVIAGDFQTGLLVDIIGVVDEVVFRHVSSKNTRVVFKIKDLSDQVLSCTLWENYCLQFLAYLNDFEDARPIVILLTHARIKEGQGSYPTSMSNSLKASKLMINELVLEIEEFSERLFDSRIEVKSVLAPPCQTSSQLSGSSQLSSKDAFLSRAEAKSICQINAISEGSHAMSEIVFDARARVLLHMHPVVALEDTRALY